VNAATRKITAKIKATNVAGGEKATSTAINAAPKLATPAHRSPLWRVVRESIFISAMLNVEKNNYLSAN